jgi:hypothetical protein
MKILPLVHYDVIVGMDWLEACSPMQVDWQHKWLLIPRGPNQVLLQGELDALPPSSVVQIQGVLSDGLFTVWVQCLLK